MPIPNIQTPIQRDNTATNFHWTKDGNQYLQGELYLAAKKAQEEAERKAKQERFANMSDAERQSWVQDQWDKTEELGEGNSATEWYHAIEENPQKEAEWDRNAAITSSVGSAIVGLPFSIGSIGLIPTLTTTATGYAGAYGGQKLGEAIDEKYGTNLAPWFSTIGGIIGGGAGYKGTVNLGSKGLLPKGGQTMYGKQFVTDVASDALSRNVRQMTPALNYGTVKYYGPTMGKTTAAKINPNLIDFDDYVRGDLDALASQLGMTRQQLMMSQDPTVREKARQLMLKSVDGWKRNPSSDGKTLVISKSDILQDPIFDNQPLVLQRPEFLKRNAARGETNLQNSMDWYASTRRKGGNKLMEWPDPEGVYISELEPFTPDPHRATFTPTQSSGGRYTFYERPSKLTEAERLGIPKGERNQPLNGHLKGDAAVQMFKEYGIVSVPENSKIYSQIQQLVPEARERYKLVGRTDITDDEIAGSLYKRAMELNGNSNAAIWETGEPRLLFRGDTRRYNRLMDKWSPEKLAKGKGTMDNSLGNLFLGDISGKGQGVDRYFISGTDFFVPKIQGSATGARGKFGTIIDGGGEGIQGTTIPYIPKDAYKLSTYQTYAGPYSLYKFPGKYSESGISDLNTFITRTPALRDATGEISVLADDVVMKTKNYRGPNINDYDGPTYDGVNPTVRDAMAKHYQSVLDDAQSKGQGLLFSEGLTDEYVKKFGEIHPFRREHEWYDYYALPNFNRQNAKHLFGWDLRRPVQWDIDNVYLEKGGKL